MFGVEVEQAVRLETVVADGLEEVEAFLEASLADELVHEGLVPLHLAVLHLALQHFLAEGTFVGSQFAHGGTYLGFGVARTRNAHPLGLGCLVVLRDDFHGLSALEFLADGDVLAADASAHAVVAHARVDGVGEVEDRGVGRQAVEVALGGEDVDVALLLLRSEAAGEERLVARFQGRTDVGQPGIHAAPAALHALVAPVGSEAVLGDFVHALGADLHFRSRCSSAR